MFVYYVEGCDGFGCDVGVDDLFLCDDLLGFEEYVGVDDV